MSWYIWLPALWILVGLFAWSLVGVIPKEDD